MSQVKLLDEICVISSLQLGTLVTQPIKIMEMSTHITVVLRRKTVALILIFPCLHFKGLGFEINEFHCCKRFSREG